MGEPVEVPRRETLQAEIAALRAAIARAHAQLDTYRDDRGDIEADAADARGFRWAVFLVAAVAAVGATLYGCVGR